MAQCQVCGQEIKGTPYYWDDDQRLPMHRNLRQCGPGGTQGFADFLNRNVEYVNRRGPPVRIGEGR